MRSAALLVAVLLVGPGLLAATPAEASHGPAGTPPMVRTDPDGASTIIALIEDQYGTLRSQPLGGVACIRSDGGVGCGAHVTSVGTYSNAWTHTWAGGSSPMLTLGLEAYSHGRTVRIPLVVLENATAPAAGDPLVAAFEQLVSSFLNADVVPVAENSAGYAAGYAAPDANALLAGLVPALGFFGLNGYPTRADTYRDHPTLFGWLVLRDEPTRTWAGYYVARSGSSSGDPGTPTASVDKRIEVGAVTRDSAGERRWGGVFLDQHAERSLSASRFDAQNDLTVGARHFGEETNLANVHMSESRENGDLRGLPFQQENEFVLGTYDTNGRYRPVFGTRSENEIEPGPSGIPQTQEWSFGPYVANEYVPVLGIQWETERWPRTFWALLFVLGGTLGDRTSGDWQIRIGTYVDGEFTPLFGVELDDSWESAQYANQTMVAFGAYVDGDFEPVLGYAYSGERTFTAWLTCIVFGHSNTLPLGEALGLPFSALYAGIGMPCQDWEMVVGTFVNDEFHPLVTVDYKDDYAGAKYGFQAMIIVGTFVAGSRVPLLGYTYSGELPLTAWATVWAFGGTLGARSSDWRMEVGTFVGGVFKPLVTLDYKDDYAQADHSYQAMIILGTVVEGTEVPLVGYTYDGEQPLLTWALGFAEGGALGSRTALDWEMEIGTFVGPQFVPVVGWTYADDFADARYTYQSEITVGAYALGRYQPLVGLTYDAEQTLVAFATQIGAGAPEANGPMMLAVGTFAGDRYVPVLGVFVAPDDATPHRTETRVLVGTFALGYGSFVPVAGARWVGDEAPWEWAPAFALGRGPGAGGDATLFADGYLVDAPAASARVAYRDDATGAWSREGTFAVSAIALGRETPRAAVKVESTTDLATWAAGRDSHDAQVRIGLEDPSTGAFTPVATVVLP